MHVLFGWMGGVPYFCVKFVFLFKNQTTRPPMKDKSNRLLLIKDIIKSNKIGSQEELLSLLKKSNFDLTQATLSRDLKQLKVAKMPDYEGGYIYVLPEGPNTIKTSWARAPEASYIANGFISVDFCGVFAVIKTKPGYSGGIAADLDQKISSEILGTIAGDDTILIIPKEHLSRAELTRILAEVLPV
jgi:transcriptional regulator of arginine metabolism